MSFKCRCNGGDAAGGSRSRQERGASLVETALTMPLLLLLVAGGLDMGRIFYAYVGLYGAAAQGARVASVSPSDNSAIVAAVVAEPQTGLAISPSNVAVAFPDGQDHGKPVTVTVAYNFACVTPLVTTYLGRNQTIPIQATAAMVVQ